MKDRVLAFINREERQHMKVLISLFTVAFIVVISAVVVQWVHASASTYYLAPTGSDSNDCSEANPCLSFNHAYQIASPGDSVVVGAGTYADQNLIEDTSKSSALQPVTFRPETDTDVTVGNIDFGATYEDKGASHVVLQDMTSTGWATLHRTTDVTLTNMIFHGGVTAIGTSQLTVSGGAWGDAAITNDGVHPEFQSYQGNDPDVNQNQLKIENVAIHHFYRPNPSVNSACLQIDDGTNITITGNRFTDCDHRDAVVSPSGLAAIDHLTFENNIFEGTKSTGGSGQGVNSLVFDATNADITNVSIRNNTFVQAWSMGTGTAHTTSGSFVGNLGYSAGSCADDTNQAWTFGHNLWIDGGNCGVSDNNDTLSNIAWTGDYHIGSTSHAIDAGDPSSCPAKDIDGDSRPQGSVCDAGADEYLVGSPAAPSNSALPTLSGSTTETEQIRTTHGSWTNSPTYTYQWQRCDSAGANCVNISGATNNIYNLVTADVGKTVRSRVSASNSGGTTVASSAVSAVITADVGAPANTVQPTVAGVLAVGSVLTATHGSWTNSPTYTYQWQRCDSAGANCVNISGATSATYTLVTADGAHTIRVAVTAANGTGTAVANSQTSNPVQSKLGDFDGNDQVNIFDLGIFLNNWMSTNSQSQDLDGNGVVNVFDLGIFLGQYNK